MIPYGRAVYEVARKEALQHLRTKRLLIFGGIFLLSLVLLTVVIPLAFFDLDTIAEDEGVSYIHNGLFALFLVLPLIGGVMLLKVLSITLTADAVCSEWQRRTVFLLLSKPVPRSAFVMGKLLGSVVPLALMFALAAALDYLVLMVLVGGPPGGMEAVRFLGALGLAAVGILAYSALGLFFSTLTRSSVPSFLFSFLVAIIVLPIIGSIGEIVYAVDVNAAQGSGDFPDPSDLKYTWTQYLDPGSVFRAMPSVLLPEEVEGGPGSIFGGGGSIHAGWSLLSAGVWSVLFTGLALVAVLRRDFE